ADRHGVAAAHRFADWRELAERPRLADAALVLTPDREHAGPAVALSALGYHVLLEKPLAPTRDECLRLVHAVAATDVVVAVGHVMRHTAYTDLVRGVVDSGRLGAIVGVEHLEPVGWWHFAHSYVRGNWRSEAGSGPSLLTKCCHDLDWLRHLVARPVRRVWSAGGLRHFTAAARPAGAADRCLDCAVEPGCPYSAPRLYLGFLGDPRREEWPLGVLTTDVSRDGVLAALRDGPYGRCVYACDNDVADHQVVTLEFDGGVVATLTMSAFTPSQRRQTRIMGTHGHLTGDGVTVTVTDFVTGAVTTEAVPEQAGHDGGDDGVIRAFLTAVATGDRSVVRTGALEALESHLLAFAAEESRATGLPVTV
ncbi:MAG TPA: Gfo/Idh/MocA family oxidoreductase, partial [Pseudonocardiaceae bacterium]